jgi:hypothetical protein
MVLLTDNIDITYNNKKYSIIKIPYKTYKVPILLNKDIYTTINEYNKNWTLNSAGYLYTTINNKLIYLHDIIYKLTKLNKLNDKDNLRKKDNKYNILHINKIPLDYRIENLMEDMPNKNIKKNLQKKSRTIKLKNINVDSIPSFIWYMKDDGVHGERFQIDLGDIKWKTTSTSELSLRYKLEEAKKYLRQYKIKNNINFLENSMNSDLNTHGIKLKQEFYKILEKNNMYYDYSFTNNTDKLLTEDLSDLTNIEKNLLKEFNIDSNITTYQRLNFIKD